MKELKNTKGITLIALIITIIVLLILAGVTISAITSNESAMNKAVEAREANERGEIYDALSLANITLTTKQLGKMDDKISYYANKETFVEKSEFDDNKYPIESYELDEENNIVTLGISKSNGTGKRFIFEIDIMNDMVTYVSNGQSDVEPEEVEPVYEESDNGYFTYTTGKSVYITGLSTEGQAAYDRNDDNLLNLVLPATAPDGKSVVGINAGTFSGMDKFKIVYLHEGITNIGNKAFENCTGIEKVKVSINFGSYNDSFAGCTNIKKVILTPGNGTGANYSTNTASTNGYNKTPWYIGTNVKVVFEEGIQTIGAYAFYNCTDIEIGELPDSLTTIGGNAFENCTGFNRQLTIKENLKTINNKAFTNTNITGTLIIPINDKSQPTLGNNCFAGTPVSKVIIEDGRTNIPNGIFQDCTSLTNLQMPINIQAHDDTFTGCTNIKNIKLTKGNGVGVGCSINTTSTNAYNKTPWYIGTNVKVVFEEGIQSIGAYAFYNCTDIEIGELPDSLTTIGSNAFGNCKGFNRQLTIKENLKTISNNAFENTNIIGTLVIPTTASSLGNNCFAGTPVSKAIIEDGRTNIPNGIFQDCTSLTNLQMPINIQAHDDTFTGCTNIKNIKLTKGNGVGVGYSINTTSTNAYNKTPWYIANENDVNIYISKGITSIGASAFYEGTKEYTFYYEGTQAEWNSSVTVRNYNSKIDTGTWHYEETINME